MTGTGSGVATRKSGNLILALVFLLLFFFAPGTLFDFLGLQYLPYFLIVGLLLFTVVSGRLQFKKARLRLNPAFVVCLCFWFGALLFLAGVASRSALGYEIYPGWTAGSLLYLACIPLLLSTAEPEESVKGVVSILIPLLFVQFVLHLVTQFLDVFPTAAYWEDGGRWYSPLLGQVSYPGVDPSEYFIVRFHSWFSEPNHLATYVGYLTVAEALLWKRKRIVAMGLLTLIGTFSLLNILGVLVGLTFTRRSWPLAALFGVLLASLLLLPSEIDFINFNRAGTTDYLLQRHTETIFTVYDQAGIAGIRDLVVEENLIFFDPLYSVAAVGLFGIAFLVLGYGSLLYGARSRVILPLMPLLVAVSMKQIPLILTTGLFGILLMGALAFSEESARRARRSGLQAIKGSSSPGRLSLG